MKNRNTVVTTLLLVCFGFLPRAQGVAPAPDGGYPGNNTAEGQNALLSLNVNTGTNNTAVGWFSLFSDTAGSFNTATGAGALISNTADTNAAFGAATLLFNTDGSDNTAVGTAALLNNTASGNTAIGSRALVNNTTGGTLGNIQGVDAGPNVAVGWQALESNTVASANTAVGYQALQRFTTGPMGFEQWGLCTAVGFQALANATGYANNAFGYQALYNNTDGTANTAIGGRTLFSNTTGGGNVANGASALHANNTGFGNTAIGFDALLNNMSGSGNTALGSSAGSGVTTASNVICIGAGVGGANVSASCYIGNIFGQVASGGSAVFVNSDNKLGTSTSSRRFKEDIKPMHKASEALFALKPVTFHYKKEVDPQAISQFGLVAEDVEKVNADLIVRDKDGKPYSVRYDQVNAMLLNEFLKEHKTVEKQEATIAELKKAIAHLAARDKEQAAQIQKVSAQIKVRTFATGRIRRGAPTLQLAGNDY